MLKFDLGITLENTSLLMIRFIPHDPKSSIDLLDQYQSHELVGVGHLPEGDRGVASFHNGFAESK